MLSIKYLPSNVFLTLEKWDQNCLTIFLLLWDLCKRIENKKKVNRTTIKNVAISVEIKF